MQPDATLHDLRDIECGFDQAALRRALGCFPTGVTIVTALAPDGRPVGVTANSFASVSMQPPLVSWNLARRSPNLEVFQHCATFAINVLAADQEALCRRFATPMPEKFDGVATSVGLDGVPLIDGAVTQFECRTTIAHPGGDHVILLGQVMRYRERGAPALLFCRGALRPYPVHTDDLRPQA
ncbi:flavin reductase family protein [Pigmentiphaga sp. D-2]|uniref:flavin reductase family protein n=1 Tax=Pigmentiphaga sp. D-2 TaxID=1002116 RepID=UPI00104A020E|nr:flavin reductase family protein [Pigmentiphaga sp. D-2]